MMILKQKIHNRKWKITWKLYYYYSAATKMETGVEKYF